MLENSSSGVPDLTESGSGNRLKVSKELQSFAMTLHFYSAKAYAYVGECFDLALPHPGTIRTWYNKISADPGFTEASFSAITAYAPDRRKEGKETICAWMMDEMSVKCSSLNCAFPTLERKDTEFKRFAGFHSMTRALLQVLSFILSF